MCSCFSEKADQCSQAMAEAAKKPFQNNQHHYETMKTISEAYLTKRK